jgi:RNA polymerase sigma-70 factor, ECF subfamily
VSDEIEWIQLARQGDQAAFGELVQCYQTPVYNLAYRLLGNAAEAEDAAQEAFIRAYQHLARYDPQRPFRTWLFSITAHYCIDRLRRQRVDWLPLEDEVASPDQVAVGGAVTASASPDPHAVAVQHERQAVIQRLLATLPPVDRAALTLCYWYDCSYEEIGETLGLSISAVKSRLFRARRALAQQLNTQQVSYVL